MMDRDDRVKVGVALSEDQRWFMTAFLAGAYPEAFCTAVAYAMEADAAAARYRARVETHVEVAP